MEYEHWSQLGRSRRAGLLYTNQEAIGHAARECYCVQLALGI